MIKMMMVHRFRSAPVWILHRTVFPQALSGGCGRYNHTLSPNPCVHRHPKSPDLLGSPHGIFEINRTHPFCELHRPFSSESLKHYYSPDFPPVGYAQKFLELVHDTTGLPWWMSILLATVTLRTVVTLPISVYSQRNVAKLVKLAPEIKEKSEQLRVEVASAIKQYNWDNKTAFYWYRKNMRRITKDMYIRDNCHPFKTTLVFWVQMPMWLGMSLALRNMSGNTPFRSLSFVESIHPELSLEGVLWFTNMMIPDPLFILPILCGLANLLNTELAALTRQDKTKLQKFVTNFYRGLGLIVVPIGMIVPSCMVYYWTCSSLYGLASTLWMKHPTMKKILGMPMLPQDSSTPYSDLWGKAKQKYGRPFRK